VTKGAASVAASASAGPTPAAGTVSAASSGARSVDASALEEEAAHLTGIGAPLVVYNARHAGKADGYGPGLSLDMVRVGAYTRTFSPAVSIDEVRRLLPADLPGDAVLAADLHPSSRCEQLWFTSAVLRSFQGPQAYVFVSLTSKTPTYAARAVSLAKLDVDLAGGPGSFPC